MGGWGGKRDDEKGNVDVVQEKHTVERGESGARARRRPVVWARAVHERRQNTKRDATKPIDT